MWRGLLIGCVLCVNCVQASAEKPVRIFVDVVGDLFHAGHVEFFKQVKSQGDYLIVGVLDDDFVESYKRVPILTLEERARVIEACKYVDEVVRACPIPIREDFIKEHHIDFVYHGDDFNEAQSKAHYQVAMDLGIFRTVPYTRGISTTNIIQRIVDRFGDK